MAKVDVIPKKLNFMFVLMGGLALILSAYFVVNSEFNSKTKADDTGLVMGKLVEDPKHVLSCNKKTKAPYVLLNPSSDVPCLPVVAEKSTAVDFVGEYVSMKGAVSQGQYYPSEINVSVKWVKPEATPHIEKPAY